MIRIEWPDGTVTTPTGILAIDLQEKHMTKGTNMDVKLTGFEASGLPTEATIVTPRVRDGATVLAELQAAMDAAARVPKLRAELDALLGRKPRGAKKGTP